MAYSILIPSSVAAKNIDALNKTAKCTAGALENGNVVKLGAISSTAGENDVYLASTPATATLATDIFYMVYEAPIPLINSKYKGISDDPREFNIAANTVFNCQKPMIGDEIILSEDGLGGSKSSNTYIIPANDTGELAWAADASTTSLGYLLTATTFISVGSTRVVAYKFRCVKTL
jgi:hypothetical protein